MPTAEASGSDEFGLWHIVQWDSQHFLQATFAGYFCRLSSGYFCFRWTTQRHQFPEVEGLTMMLPQHSMGAMVTDPTSDAPVLLQLPRIMFTQETVTDVLWLQREDGERGWGYLSEQEVAELYFQGGHFCSAFLSLIFPICYVTLICPLWCQETPLVSMKFFDAWQPYVKNKIIRVCFYLYHFYLDISSCPVLPNTFRKKIIYFFNELMNGTSPVQSWFPSHGVFLLIIRFAVIWFSYNTAYDLLFPLKTMCKSPTPLP